MDFSVEQIAVPVAGVDAWLVDLAQGADTVSRAELTLTPVELARARRGVPAVRARRVLLRAALRSALGAELRLDPRRVPLGRTAAGRPFVVPSVADPVMDVSCSASGTIGVVVLSRLARVGVDVEQVAPWAPEVLEEAWLTDGERATLVSLRAADRAAAVTRSWTQKEAVLKAAGTGLHGDPAGSVTPIGSADGIVAGWHVDGLPVPDGWLASLATGPRWVMPT
ncbi:4'-phosphopantetheinyl transferase superfamily protein [Blastococcus sp. HT6-30]|uniref:4'-phosphopantetheinyl transferase family protein n=1 Tax=Blastococcus sp. HT6-30 TaxID=3144843 RepID=UPI00321A973C